MKGKVVPAYISPTKGHHPREKVLHQVDVYNEVMSTILKAIHVRHKEHALAVRTSLLNANDAVFQHQMASMQQHRAQPDDELQKKIQFNDSVSRLRTLHNQMREKINDLARPKKEEIYEPVPE